MAGMLLLHIQSDVLVFIAKVILYIFPSLIDLCMFIQDNLQKESTSQVRERTSKDFPSGLFGDQEYCHIVLIWKKLLQTLHVNTICFLKCL